MERGLRHPWGSVPGLRGLQPKRRPHLEVCGSEGGWIVCRRSRLPGMVPGRVRGVTCARKPGEEQGQRKPTMQATRHRVRLLGIRRHSWRRHVQRPKPRRAMQATMAQAGPVSRRYESSPRELSRYEQRGRHGRRETNPLPGDPSMLAGGESGSAASAGAGGDVGPRAGAWRRG